jgi:hypothetical protein
VHGGGVLRHWHGNVEVCKGWDWQEDLVEEPEHDGDGDDSDGKAPLNAASGQESNHAPQDLKRPAYNNQNDSMQRTRINTYI